jgi:hypothetical protein
MAIMPEAPATRGTIGRLVGRLAAEFGIVVLGVTVALGADSWADNRQERRIESARLVALLANVESTLSDVRTARENAEGAASALRELVGFEPQRGGQDLRDLILYGFFYVPTFHPELNVYEDLKSSGELALLTDASLRSALSEMDARLEQLRIAQADITTVQQLNLDTYLLTRLDLRSVMSDLLELDGGGSVTLDPEVVGDLVFRNLVIFKLDLVAEIAQRFSESEESLDDVRRLIEGERS